MDVKYSYNNGIINVNIVGTLSRALSAYTDYKITLSGLSKGSTSDMANLTNDFVPVLFSCINGVLIINPTKAIASGQWVCVSLTFFE